MYIVLDAIDLPNPITYPKTKQELHRIQCGDIAIQNVSYEGLFSVVSVCWSVCLSVCQHDNSRTVRDIIKKFSGPHPTVERADKFKNGYIGVHGW